MELSGPSADFQDFVNEMYGKVKADLLAAIDDGALGEYLEKTLNGAFSWPNATTTALPSRFYPDLHGNSGTCKNDDDSPYYMRNNDMWYDDTLEECCERHFSISKHQCLGEKYSFER